MYYEIIISSLITENDDTNANEPIKTKRTLKRANTEAVTGCGGESRQFMTKSSNNKDFISKDEARRRMMSWRKTTSLRYSSTTNPYHSVNTKKWLLFFRQTNCTQMSGSCHLDRALNIKIGVECQIFVMVIFFNYGRVLQFGAHSRSYKGVLTQKR